MRSKNHEAFLFLKNQGRNTAAIINALCGFEKITHDEIAKTIEGKATRSSVTYTILGKRGNTRLQKHIAKVLKVPFREMFPNGG